MAWCTVLVAAVWVHVRLVLTLALPCLRMQVWYQHSSAEPPSSKPSNA